MINSFVRRLKKIGVDVQLVGNYPWVYLDSVNGRKVQEKFYANHGFTAFVVKSNKVVWSDRRKVFKKIREMLKNT
jgi:hypothetical protein